VTELATIPHAPGGNGLAAIQPMSVSVTHAGLDALHRWVQSADEAAQLVARIIDTPFVPESYRPQVDPRATLEQRQAAREVAIGTGTAAVLLGISIGLDPLTSLQQIYVVHGRPGMYTKIKVALVQAAGHEVWTEEQSGTRVAVAGRRKGSDVIERVTITMDMARAAGWTRNAAYGKTPADMLWARAAGRVCDRIASDVLNGIASVEEIQDDEAEAAPQRTVRRAPRAVAPTGSAERPALPGDQAVFAAGRAGVEDERGNSAVMTTVVERPAPAGPPLPGEEPPAETGEQINDAQQRKMQAQFRDLGLGGRSDDDRARRLRVASVLVERQVDASADLTKAEATALIDRLEALLGQPDDQRAAAIQFMTADREEPPADETLPLPGDGDDGEAR
jgi:hypothetical protein